MTFCGAKSGRELLYTIEGTISDGFDPPWPPRDASSRFLESSLAGAFPS
jgi:hypothetical protein